MQITKKILLHLLIICVLVVDVNDKVNIEGILHCYSSKAEVVERVVESTPYGLGLSVKRENTCAAVDLKESEAQARNASALMPMKENLQEFIDLIVDLIFDFLYSFQSVPGIAIPRSTKYNRIVMVIRKGREEASMWTFLKPFTPRMWCTTATVMISTALVVWLLEQKINPVVYREMSITEVFVLIWPALSTMSLSQNVKIESRLSRVVIAIWLLVMSIIVSSYTDNFNSRLNAQQTNPTLSITSFQELISHVPVGYLKHHVIQDYLHSDLGIELGNLKAYTTAEQCAQALSKGRNRGVTVVFMDLVDAFRFVSRRPRNAIHHIPLVEDPPPEAKTPNSLGVNDFLGWFIITGTVSTLAIIIFFFNLLHGLGTNPDDRGQGTDPLDMVPQNDDPEEHFSLEGDSLQTMGITNISNSEEIGLVEPSSVYIPHVADESRSMEDQNI